MKQYMENAADLVVETDHDWGVPDGENNNDREESLLEASSTVPWGLDRVDQTDLPLSQSYSPAGGGTNVDVYVADTGIYISHVDFGGRAKAAMDFTVWSGFKPQMCQAKDTQCANDRHGHGTHCAATIGGRKYGIAKSVTLHAVKVMRDSGWGLSSWIIDALDEVETK